MPLRRLQVTDFRCLRSADLSFDPHFTLISGPNASGKTSVLEAVYVLGRGRSFRTRKLDNLIRSGSSSFVVFGETETSIDGAPRRIGMGIEGSSDGLRGKIAGSKLDSLADLALSLPVQVIDPEVHRLIEEGPSRRRRFMDWGVFHVEHTFVGIWQRYQQSLKQRNAALKARQSRSAIHAWDAELIRLAEAISAARVNYVYKLGDTVAPIARNLLRREVSLAYRAGWSAGQTFVDALEQSWALDQERGLTHVGPQRADLQIRVDGVMARDRVSRGQQKLLAAALLVAQLKFFKTDAPIQPTLLLDDPAAELDAERLLALIGEVSAKGVQLVVTTLAGDMPAFGRPGRHYGICDGTLVAK